VKRRRGRILAIKWGMNPNSSSLGVDVTFLLAGATALAMVTPVVGALLRWRRPVSAGAASTASGALSSHDEIAAAAHDPDAGPDRV
jgi:hypothetical protein